MPFDAVAVFVVIVSSCGEWWRNVVVDDDDDSHCLLYRYDSLPSKVISYAFGMFILSVFATYGGNFVERLFISLFHIVSMVLFESILEHSK